MRRVLFCLCLLALVGACATRPRPFVFQTTPEQQRLLLVRARTFTLSPQQNIMSACIDTLQDMGYVVEETSAPLGLIVASRSIKEGSSSGGLLGLSLGIAVGLGNLGLGGNTGDMLTSTVRRAKQRIMVYYGAPNKGSSKNTQSVTVRLTIQESKHVRQRYADGKEKSRTYFQTVEDAGPYNEVFARLGKSLFLEQNYVT